MKLVLKSWSWKDFLELIYQLGDRLKEAGHNQVPYGLLVHLFQFAPFELVMRKSPWRDALRLMQPSAEQMFVAFVQAGGSPEFGTPVVEEHNASMRHTLRHARLLLGEDPDVSNPLLVHVGAIEQYVATTMGTFAMKLGDTQGPLASARYLTRFVNFGRNRLSDDQLAAWEELERQRGMGIVLGHLAARELDPSFTAVLAAAFNLLKYGLPDSSGVHTCHWCGCAPCRCGGAKAGKRVVTLEEALSLVSKLGPMDCWIAMLLDYSLARNPALGGGAYGEFRTTMEVDAEAVTADLIIKAGGDLNVLAQRLGPFFDVGPLDEQGKPSKLFGQLHLKELMKISDLPSALRHARADWSDRSQWVFAGSRFFHIPRGLELALRSLAGRLGVELEMPSLPEIPEIYRS